MSPEDKSPTFRELQFSSAQLVVFFLAILVLGIFIFLLGVSVGKKQSQLAQSAPSSSSSLKTEQLAQKTVLSETQAKAAQDLPAQKEAALPEPKPGTSAGLGIQKEAPQAAGSKKEGAPATGAATEAKTGKETPKEGEVKKTDKAATETTGVTTKTAVYYVQVGAVKDKNAALAFVKKIEREGLEAFVIDPLASDKNAIYRIRLGPYETRAEAESVRVKLAAALKKKSTDYFIVKG
jgi:cell division septation protein DedD